MKLKKLLRSQRGWTIMELMIVVAVLALITPGITLLFLKCSQGMVADEMHNNLKIANEQTMNLLNARLQTSKRIFQGNTNGVSMLGLVNLAGGGAPAALTGSLLPQEQPEPSLSPSAVNFSGTDVGNSIFCAVYDSNQTISSGSTKFVYPAPATITGVADSGSTIHTVVLDMYRFYYYYLTAVNSHTLTVGPTYQLVEWQSGDYVDYNELNAITDATLQQNVITTLTTPVTVASFIYKTVSGGVTMAWDPTQNNPTTGFYKLTAGSALPTAALTTVPNLNQTQYNNMIYVQNDILSRGSLWGVASNTALLPGSPVTVPEYATRSGSFPGGFEIVLGGSGSGEQMLIRSVLVSKGAAPGIEDNDLTNITNVRDVW
jgi:type II secretory pathway pseudopilin PulG